MESSEVSAQEVFYQQHRKDGSMNNSKNTMGVIKQRIAVIGITLLSLIITAPAHADFRKALDAYIARDGDTMLKEVKDALDKKNDDGLMLLLMATNMDAATSDYDETAKQSKSTLRTILPQSKWDEMRELLVQATNNSTVDAQYSLLKSQFGKDIVTKYLDATKAKRGEKPDANYSLQETNKGYGLIEKELAQKGHITSSSDIVKRAESGDYSAQQFLGLAYLHYTGEFAGSCGSNPDSPACKSKDDAKGYEWLKKSALTYERQGLPTNFLGGADYPIAMCDFYQSKPDANPLDLRQAYLWCLLGFNSGSINAPTILRKMDQAGKLKIAAPVWYEKIWKTGKYWEEKRNVYKVKEWPSLLAEARKVAAHEPSSIFNYSFKEGDYGIYELDIYADGHVFIKDQSMGETKVLLTTVHAKKVKKFITDLGRAGFDRWPLSDGGSACDMPCSFTQSSAMLRTGGVPRRVSFFSDKMVLASATKSPMMIREARLKVLVDTYFPTKQLRIELGNSEKLKQKFLTREAEWIELAKKGD